MTPVEKLQRFYDMVLPHINGHHTAQKLFLEALIDLHKMELKKIDDKEVVYEQKIKTLEDQIDNTEHLLKALRHFRSEALKNQYFNLP